MGLCCYVKTALSLLLFLASAERSFSKSGRLALQQALSDDITLQEVLAALRELEDGDNSTKKPEESEAQSDQETNKEAEKILEDLNTKVKPGKDNTDAGGEPAKEVESEDESGDENTEKEDCSDRQFAIKGSSSWCRCNGKRQAISSKEACEHVTARAGVCSWSSATSSCIPSASRPEEKQSVTHEESPASEDESGKPDDKPGKEVEAPKQEETSSEPETKNAENEENPASEDESGKPDDKPSKEEAPKQEETSSEPETKNAENEENPASEDESGKPDDKSSKEEAPKHEETSSEPETKNAENEEATEALDCSSRKSASKGSSIWCRCDSKLRAVWNQYACEHVMGRAGLCTWSAATKSCRPAGEEKQEAADEPKEAEVEQPEDEPRDKHFGYERFRKKEQHDLEEEEKFPELVKGLEEQAQKVIQNSKRWKALLEKIQRGHKSFESLLKLFRVAVKKNHLAKVYVVEELLAGHGKAGEVAKSEGRVRHVESEDKEEQPVEVSKPVDLDEEDKEQPIEAHSQHESDGEDEEDEEEEEGGETSEDRQEPESKETETDTSSEKKDETHVPGANSSA